MSTAVEEVSKQATKAFVDIARRHGVVDIRYSVCRCVGCRDGLTSRAVTMFYLAIWQEPQEAKARFADEAALVIGRILDASGLANENALIAVWKSFEIALQRYGALARDATPICVGNRTTKDEN